MSNYGHCLSADWFPKILSHFLKLYLGGEETCCTLLIDCIKRALVYWMKSLDFSGVRVLTEPFHLHLSQSNHDNNFHCANVPYPSWYCVWESLWLSCNNLLTPIKCRFFPLQLCNSHKCGLGLYVNPNYHRSIQPIKQLLRQRGAQSMMSHLHLAALAFLRNLFLGKNLEDRGRQSWSDWEGGDLPIYPCIRVFLSLGRAADNPGLGSWGKPRSRLATGVTFLED